jgi:MaoC like domain
VELLAHDVVARNLPEHARNPIHTDAGARAAGFPRALVAGVTTYAYLCGVPLAAGGAGWLAGGGGEVRFRAPVFDGDRVSCVPVGDVVEARTTDVRAVLNLAADRSRPVLTGDSPLRPMEMRLDGEYGSDYAVRAGDHDEVCAPSGTVHPAVWPALANQLVHRQLARGPWIHTRSRIVHRHSARQGDTAVVSAEELRRFHRSGERVVLWVQIHVGDRLVAELEHEAIIDVDGAIG